MEIFLKKYYYFFNLKIVNNLLVHSPTTQITVLIIHRATLPNPLEVLENNNKFMYTLNHSYGLYKNI